MEKLINQTQEMICPKCGYIGQKERFSQGSFLLEMFLWLLFFVPGAIYTTWRAFNEFKACPKCKSIDMAPLSSSFGKKIQTENQRLRAPLSEKEELEFLSKILK